MEVNKVVLGKMEVKLKEYPDDFFDSMVTDPPYGFGKEPNIVQVMKDWVEKGYHEVESKSGGFMGKKWDSFVPQPIQFKLAFRVLKPGAYALVACGTRTQDWMAASLRFAGFEVRDVITWHYGSGFPKSLDISKAIDKQAGAERIDTGLFKQRHGGGVHSEKISQLNPDIKQTSITEASTDEAKQWEGWGTALKPATEFWTLCRKPISENTVAENVLKHGTGGINIDACRIGDDEIKTQGGEKFKGDVIYNKYNNCEGSYHTGRFPANLILDEFMAAELDKQSGILTSGNVSSEGFKGEYTGTIYGKFKHNQIPGGSLYGDSGGASRFFYVAKPSQGERNKGLRMNQAKFMDESREEGSIGGTNPRNRGAESKRNNFHPTVKPIELMRYLVKMITSKGGICIDPFCGSGSTLIACKMEEINYVGIDTEPEYCEISEARIKAWHLQTDLFNE